MVVPRMLSSIIVSVIFRTFEEQSVLHFRITDNHYMGQYRAVTADRLDAQDVAPMAVHV